MVQHGIQDGQVSASMGNNNPSVNTMRAYGINDLFAVCYGTNLFHIAAHNNCSHFMILHHMPEVFCCAFHRALSNNV